MTTREKNLKRINEELEKLYDEQLEEIAGGNRDPKFPLIRLSNVIHPINQTPDPEVNPRSFGVRV